MAKKVGFLDKLGFFIRGGRRGSRKASRAGRRYIRGYDAAANNRHTETHFTDATNYDADSFITDSLATLRNRARYEVRNNCYAKGITDTRF
jgi:capsid protein